MKNNLLKWAMIVAAVIALLSLLVGAFDGLAAPVAKMLNKPVESVKGVARTMAAVAIGALVLMAGVMVIGAVPVLGVALLAVGAMTVLTSLGVFGSNSEG